MNKTLIAVPTAALIGMSTLGVATATSASAAPVEASVSAVSAVPSISKKERAKYKKRARAARIKYRYAKRFKVKKREINEIRAAKRWAKGWKPRAVRRCESGGYYKINTGNGYYGAYQFAAGTWRGVGGGRYTAYAHQAPKFAQDQMAYRLWKRSGWGPWGCA